MKKIDVHCHVSMWEHALVTPDMPYITPEELKKTFSAFGIEKGMILPLISPEGQFTVQTNEETEHIANMHHDHFYWFCNIDPRMGDNNAKTDFSVFLEHYKKRGAIGVGEVTANLYIDDPVIQNLFYHCGELDMPVTIHMAPGFSGGYGLVDDIGLPRLEKMLKKYPKLKILGHSTCFWSEISDNVTEENRDDNGVGKANGGRIAEIMRECPNLYCDLSAGSGYHALNRDKEHAYRFIEEFSDRLLFGSDITAPNQRAYMSEWLDEEFEKGNISKENYRKICRENAIRLFHLKDEV